MGKLQVIPVPKLAVRTANGLLCKICQAFFDQPTKQDLNYAWQECAKQKCGLMHIDENEFPVSPDDKIIYYSGDRKIPAWIHDKKNDAIKIFIEPPKLEEY